MRILILEDDDLLRSLWTEALSDAGHTVKAVRSLAEASKIIKFVPFDLLVSDLLLDGEPSLPLLQTANYHIPGARIILVTGSGWFGCGELMKIAPNIDLTLRKPISVADMLAYVDHVGNQSKVEYGANQFRIAKA